VKKSIKTAIFALTAIAFGLICNHTSAMEPRTVTFTNNSLVPLELTIITPNFKSQTITLGPSTHLYGAQYVTYLPWLGQYIQNLTRRISSPEQITLDLNEVQTAKIKIAPALSGIISGIQIFGNFTIPTGEKEIPLQEVKANNKNTDIRISLNWDLLSTTAVTQFKNAITQLDFRIEKYIPAERKWFAWFRGGWQQIPTPAPQPAQMGGGIAQPQRTISIEEFEMITSPEERQAQQLEQQLDRLITQLQNVIQVRENYFTAINNLEEANKLQAGRIFGPSQANISQKQQIALTAFNQTKGSWEAIAPTLQQLIRTTKEKLQELNTTFASTEMPEALLQNLVNKQKTLLSLLYEVERMAPPLTKTTIGGQQIKIIEDYLPR